MQNGTKTMKFPVWYFFSVMLLQLANILRVMVLYENVKMCSLFACLFKFFASFLWYLRIYCRNRSPCLQECRYGEAVC